MPKSVNMGKLDKEVFIEYFDMEKKVIFSFKFKNCCVHTKVDPEIWKRFIENCKKQKEEQGNTKTKVLAGISPTEILYADNFELEKCFAENIEERKFIGKLEKILGKDKHPSKDLVYSDVSISIGDFNITLDKNKYFKVRDCIINSGRKLEKIVRGGRKQ